MTIKNNNEDGETHYMWMLYDGQMVFQDRGFSGWSSLISKELAQRFK